LLRFRRLKPPATHCRPFGTQKKTRSHPITPAAEAAGYPLSSLRDAEEDPLAPYCVPFSVAVYLVLRFGNSVAYACLQKRSTSIGATAPLVFRGAAPARAAPLSPPGGTPASPPTPAEVVATVRWLRRRSCGRDHLEPAGCGWSRGGTSPVGERAFHVEHYSVAGAARKRNFARGWEASQECRMPDARCQMPDAKCQTPDPRRQMASAPDAHTTEGDIGGSSDRGGNWGAAGGGGLPKPSRRLIAWRAVHAAGSYQGMCPLGRLARESPGPRSSQGSHVKCAQREFPLDGAEPSCELAQAHPPRRVARESPGGKACVNKECGSHSPVPAHESRLERPRFAGWGRLAARRPPCPAACR